MLTKEIIKQNPVLSSLTDEQLVAITTLSQNDENAVISAKVKEIHSQYDKDIKELTGKEKPQGLKTYEHLKQVISELKTTPNADFEKKIKTLEAEKDKLKKEIETGVGDALKNEVENLKKQLADKQSELKKVRSSFEEEKNTFLEQIKAAETEKQQIELNYLFDNALNESGVTFKKEIPENILKETIKYRKTDLLKAINPDYITGADGKKVLVFRDKDGEIMRNPENGLNPFKPSELILNRMKDLIEVQEQKTGAGTGTPAPGNTTTLDLSGVKTQMDANTKIVDYLLKVEGIAKTNPKFAERQTEIIKENQVDELPIR